jgi:hypothetical protein
MPDATGPTTGARWTPSRGDLRIAAGVLAYVVASVHLFHPKLGGRRLVKLLTINPGVLATDPRPLAFVVSGLALVVGVLLVQRDRLPERPALLAGAGLMVIYIVGYFGWHLSGHGGFLPGREPLYHDFTPLEAVAAHLGGDPFALTAVLSELALLLVLLALLRQGTAARTDERNP